jgi:hypothetical protein
MLDTRILLGAQGVQAPDAVQGYSKLAQLAQLKQAQQLQQMQLEEAERKRAASDAIGGALGDLDITNDEQVRTKLGQLPAEARPEFVKFVQVQREQIAKAAKERAEAEGKQFGNRTAQLGFVGQLAGALAENPTPEAWRTAKRNLEAAGLNPALLDVPDGVDPRQHFGQLANSALTAAQQADARDKAATRQLTADRDAATKENYLRQDARSRDATAAQMANAAANREQAAAFRAAGFAQAQATRDAARETANATRVDSQTQALSKQVDANALPNLITSATALNDTLKQYAGKSDIPGVGIIDANTPPALRSAEGNRVRSQIQAVANDLLKLYSGGAVTANEAERRATEMMASGQFNEASLRDAWPLVVGRINAATQNVRAGYSPQAVETYEGRGGVPLRPIEAVGSSPREFQSMPDPATLAGKRIQAPDGTIYKSDGKKWVRQ